MSFYILMLIPVVSSKIEFMSIGDWGDSGAKTLATYMGHYDPEWILAIGDNFYNAGISGADDPLIQTVFEQTFTSDKLNVPWYVCAGNHDWYGGMQSIQGEIDYSGRSFRWNFVDFYYDQVIKKNGISVLIVAVDTWKLNGGDAYVNFDSLTNRSSLKNKTEIEWRYQIGADDMGKEKHDILIKTFPEDDPNDPVVSTPDDKQYQWIRKTLLKSNADWKIVMGHFPVYSCTVGEHGDTPNLKRDLLPILIEGEVDVYFCGHDHILQHIYRDGIHFIGSGAGSRVHVGVNSQYNGLKGYVEGLFGFIVHTITKTKLTSMVVTQDNTKPFNFTINKNEIKKKRTNVKIN